MDSNGTRFHLFLGRDDWARRCTDRTGATRLEPIFDASKAGGDADFSWDERRHELTLGSRVFHFVPSSGNRAVTLDARRGAAADVHGNIYWIDETGSEIRVHSSGSRATSHFWSSLDGCCEKRVEALFAPIDVATPKPIPLAGLAVTTEHELVVGTTDPAGLLVFDLHRGGEPRQLLWPVPFTPFDIAATDDGGVWILDRQHACAWRLDRTMGVVPIGAAPPPPSEETFQPVDGDEPRCKPPASITSNMARTLTVTDAVAIEALPDDSILILDTPPLAKFSRIVRIHRDGTTHEASTEVAKSLVEESKRAEFTMRGHDFVAVTDVSSRPSEASGGTPSPRVTLYVAGSDGDQAVAFQLDPHGHGTAELHPLAEFYPMRLFGARALIKSSGQPFYDADDRWVPLIAQKRVRYAREATLLIPELDGKTPDCVWHRLMLDACIPPECDVVVESRATNDPSLFDLATWSTEPRLLRRATGTELAWSHDLRDAGLETWELLFQRATGRYLQLRITLIGNG
ncbi:MAG TPA: hypothetical protein VFO89_08775, partial [Thermoanaerobaculia bacterium]|nr:hypothetical protein [Thermoanaerobaculia bacterium]